MSAIDEVDCFQDAQTIMDSFVRVTKPLLDGRLSKLPEDLYCSVYAIDWCCKETSSSIVMLLKHGKLWDAQILLRTVINATAKMCYLLSGSAKDRAKRTKEYVELATKKDFGSMEQPLDGLFAMGAYGTGDRLRFAEREFKEKTAKLKTQIGEGAAVREAANHLDYLSLTRILENEFWYWKEVRKFLDFEYSAANKVVHVNYTGCCEVMQRIAKIQNTTYGMVEDQATLSHILFVVCVLYRVRSEIVFQISGEDPAEMRKILVKDNPFVRYSQEMCDKASDRLLGVVVQV